MLSAGAQGPAFGASQEDMGASRGNAECSHGDEQRSGKHRRKGAVEGHGVFLSKIRHRVNVICTSFACLVQE